MLQGFSRSVRVGKRYELLAVRDHFTWFNRLVCFLIIFLLFHLTYCIGTMSIELKLRFFLNVVLFLKDMYSTGEQEKKLEILKPAIFFTF